MCMCCQGRRQPPAAERSEGRLGKRGCKGRNRE
nr:MAG TPA: hypothetical protein [Caudoviricetes sp.]